MGQLKEIHFGRYRLHPVQGLACGALRIPVTPKALAVLLVLIARAGQVVTKDELFRAVWGDTIVSDAALTSCIQELRRALADDARAPRYIQTHHRCGFRFIDRVREMAPRNPARQQKPDAERPAVAHFVGRGPAVKQLAQAWAMARAGVRQMVFVTGEAGIGKTTLVHHFLAAAVDSRETRICLTACVERFGVFEAYQPLLEALPRLSSGTDAGKRMAVLRRCAPMWLAQLPALQRRSESAALQRRTAGATPDRMLRELADALEALAQIQPIILCIEDLQWSDVATLDWLTSFAHRPERAAVLIVGTLRTGEPSTGARSPQATLATLRLRDGCSEIALARLDLAAVQEYVGQRCSPAPDSESSVAALAEVVHRHSDGNPLFAANILADFITRGILYEHDDRWTVIDGINGEALGVPDTIRLTIEQQVVRLTVAEQRLLEVASVSPGSCTSATIAAAAGMTAVEVDSTLLPLARRGAFLREVPATEWPDGTFSTTFEFLHALYREVLYTRMLAGQRAHLHHQVATRLEIAFGRRAPEIAGELAMHFERARAFPRAIHYLLHAGDNDARRSAHESAQTHFRHALTLIEKLPPSADRDRSEAASRIGLGSVLTQLRGWGAVEVEHEYARAQTLSERHGAHDLSFSASWNLWVGSIARGQIEDAYRRSKTVFELASCSSHSVVRLQGHHALWTTAFARGDFEQVAVHTQAGISLYDPGEQQFQAYGSHDACVCARAFQARTAAVSGQPLAARRAIDEAVALARRLGHPFTLSFSLMHASAVCLELGNPAAALQRVTEAAQIAEEQNFGLMLAWTTCFRGAAMAALGHRTEGVTCLAAGIAKAQSTGSDMFLPHFRLLLAEGQIHCGRYSDAYQNIDDALALVDRNGERTYLADLHRLRGQLGCISGALPDSTVDGKHELRVALSTARQQGAQLLALRAALDLSRVLEREGEYSEASALMAEARAGITETASFSLLR